MEHPGNPGLRRETLLLVEGLDQITLDSPALGRFQVLDPALDLDQEDLFQEGLDLYLGIPSMTIVALTHSILPWHPSRHPVLPHNRDREPPDVPPEGRGQPPNPL